MIDPRTTTVEVRRSSGVSRKVVAGAVPWEYFRILKDRALSKTLRNGTICAMGMAEDAFERLRRIAFEGEHVERMAALGVRLKLSPGVIKTLMRLSKADGVSMGEMARGIGCDPSYITALVDDLDERGLARREPAPDDRRVKIIVLTDAGRAVAEEIDADPFSAASRSLLSVRGRTAPVARPAGQGSRAKWRRCGGRCAGVARGRHAGSDRRASRQVLRGHRRRARRELRGAKG